MGKFVGETFKWAKMKSKIPKIMKKVNGQKFEIKEKSWKSPKNVQERQSKSHQYQLKKPSQLPYPIDYQSLRSFSY